MDLENVLLFGGTFDPIHHGHLIVCREVARQLNIEKIVLVPSANPPHKPDASVTDIALRYEMARLAVEGDSVFEVSDCEIKRDGPSYTLDTIRYFRELYGQSARLCWLIGADTIPELAKWYQISKLVDECDIVTAARPGYDIDAWLTLEDVLTKDQLVKLQGNVVNAPLVDVSSTRIRHRVAEGKGITQMVQASVKSFILKNDIYAVDRKAT